MPQTVTTPKRHLLNKRLFLVLAPLALLATVALYSALPASGIFGAGTGTVLYTSDGSTRLFDNFEGVTLADSTATQVTFAAGYLGGQALFLPDTGSYAIYSDSWWLDRGDGFQESGTIEFYYRPETFIFTNPRPYATLLTQDERAAPPLTGGLPTLAVFNATDLSWGISPVGATNDASVELSLYPGQWYHIAATWGSGGLNLYVNDTLVATENNSDTIVRADTFLLGGTGILPTQGLSARGRIDRFRLSSRARTAGEFPAALDVVIDSPTTGSYTIPFPLTYRAYATETRTRLVDIYTDTDNENFNGVAVALNLSESGTVLIGNGLTSDTYFLYAVAHAGGDSAYFYTQDFITLTLPPGFDTVVDPVETTAAVTVTPTTTPSFTAVLLNGGGTTSGSLAPAADSVGTNANYTVTARLMNAFDTAKLSIWTKETSPAILIGIRSDTASLNAAYLPKRIPATAAGLNAFGATILSTEFLLSNGQMIGDTSSTRYIGDTFAYTVEFQLSGTTTLAFRNLGFDTAAGSKSFSFYFADTYGARWIEDTTVTVSVVAGTNGGIRVRVAGITKDLPGGLGGASVSNSTTQGDAPGWCLLKSAGAPEWLLKLLRALRDILLEGSLGRWFVGIYYD